MSACLFPGAWLSAAPGNLAQPGETVEKPSLDELIHNLSDERYKVREAATRTIWDMGEKVLPELNAVADGKDPEAAYRARELVRKIELSITSETDPEVMRLVERYGKASVSEKQDLIGEMVRKRAWRQILRLFASEKNPELIQRVKGTIDLIAVTAARECLVADDAEGAREFLEMAPADAPGLLALAEFHRSQGTLETEVKRAKSLDDKVADAWLLALYRASGNVEAARVAADAAGETSISAILSLMLGDPMPWLRCCLDGRENAWGDKTYTALALERWQGKVLGAAELQPLVRSAALRASQSRANSINALYLLGEVKLAEEAYVKVSTLDGFSHLESLERIPEALAVFGLDGEKPDYKSWVAKRFSQLANVDEDSDLVEVNEAEELLMLANFMDRRGMVAEFQDAFVKPMEELAREDEGAFTDFLSRMFGANMRFGGAPDVVRRLGYDWAGDEDSRWDDLVRAAFGENEPVHVIWNWLAEIDPAANRIDRFDGLLALADMGTDPMRLRERWLDLGWQEVEKTPVERRKDVLTKLAHAVNLKPDVENNLKLWDAWPENERDGFFRDTRVSELTIAGRWDEAADFFLKQIERVGKYKLTPSPAVHASAAACLRKAGRVKEAAVQDRWVDKLFLGNGAYQIAVGYQFGDDFERSAQWIKKAVLGDEPDPLGSYDYVLRQYGESLLEQGEWKEAAAALEVAAQMASSPTSSPQTLMMRMGLRIEADLGRALSILATDRETALAMLDRAYAMSPGDGTLADYFFPAVRRAGLISQHDSWFQTSWERLTAVAKRYPGSSNTLNTTGWLAAKAHRKLKEAKDYQARALALKPAESSYLDTMAEIEFASGDREKALEWSAKAVNFTPGGVREDGSGSTAESFMLRRQQAHFRNDAMPR